MITRQQDRQQRCMQTKGRETMGVGGRPPKYKSVKEMQKKIDEYFESCEGKPLVINGEQQYNKQGYPIILDRKHPTITGLALALGFSGRSDLLYYQKHKKTVISFTTPSRVRRAELKNKWKKVCSTRTARTVHNLH